MAHMTENTVEFYASATLFTSLSKHEHYFTRNYGYEPRSQIWKNKQTE